MEKLPLHVNYREGLAIPASRPASPAEQLQYERFAFDVARRISEEKTAQTFIQSAVATLDSQYHWVADLSPSLVRESFIDITTFREAYHTQHQAAPSDWHTFRHFRLEVETDTPSDRDMHTVLLLEALMNGDVRNGTLPQIPKMFL